MCLVWFQVQDLSSKMDHLASQAEDSHAVRRLEAKVRELESRLELEQTAKSRLEVSAWPIHRPSKSPS